MAREAPQRSSRSKVRVETERVGEAETTLHRLQARGERLLQWFPEMRKTWQRDAEPAIEALVAQIQTLGGQVSRRAQETGRDLESRAERVLADLERQAVRGLGPILSRANLASGSELSDLETRMLQIEEHLQERLAPLADAQSGMASGLTAVQSALQDARVEATERFREMTVRIAAGDELRSDLNRVHEHLDALSKDQVTRSLEIGKLHDRLVRLEMRMGDVLREQAGQLGAQQEAARRTTTLEEAIAESHRAVQAVREDTDRAAGEGRATDARLTALTSARNLDHDEIARLADLLGSVQQTLRQVDLRLGDLGERYTGIREELASLSARVSHLELAPARPVSAAMLTERNEGH